MQRGMQSKLIKAKSIPLIYRKSNQEREREREREREKERAYLQFALRREDWIETKRRKPNKMTTIKERERERKSRECIACLCLCLVLLYIRREAVDKYPNPPLFLFFSILHEIHQPFLFFFFFFEKPVDLFPNRHSSLSCIGIGQ